jgi:hypothetical protein
VTAAPLPSPAVDQPDFDAVASMGSVDPTPVAAEPQELSQSTPFRPNPPDVVVGDETHSSLAGVGSAHDPAPVDAAVAATDDIDVGALFINSLQLPLQESLLHTPPRRRAARREPASLSSFPRPQPGEAS